MNDEKEKPFDAEEGDPEEVKVVQDIFDLPIEESSPGDVFEQDLFAVPPPPPPPAPEEAAPPPEHAAVTQHPPKPQPPEILSPVEESPAEQDSGVMVVGPEDFDTLASPRELSVEGKAYPPGTSEEPAASELEDDDMPDIVVPAEPYREPDHAAERESPPTPSPPAEVTAETKFVETLEVGEDAEPLLTDEDISMEAESDPMIFKAAKAKEGPEAVRQTQEFIERLDGMDQGFIDTAEIARTIKLVGELQEKIRKLEARIKALEASLK